MENNQKKSLIDTLVNESGKVDYVKYYLNLTFYFIVIYVFTYIVEAIVIYEYLNFNNLIILALINIILTGMVVYIIKSKYDFKIFSKSLINIFNLQNIEIEDKNENSLLFKTKNTNEEHLKKLQDLTKSLSNHFNYEDSYVKWMKSENGIQLNYLVMKFFTKKELEDINKIEDFTMKKKVIYTAGGIVNFIAENIGNKKIDFILRQNAINDKSELENAIPKLANFFNKNSGKLIDDKGKGVYTLQFKNQIPKIEDKLPKLSPEIAYKEDKHYIGVHDIIENEYCYTSPVKLEVKEAKTCKSCKKNGKKKDCKDCIPVEYKTKLTNGHELIVGGSGSGKSFFIKEYMKNKLRPYGYKLIERINIVNLKGSNDFEVFKDFDKVEVTGIQMSSAFYRLKETLYEMNKRYIYMKQHGYDNYPGGDWHLIIDEAQSINLNAKSSSLKKVERSTWAEMEVIVSTILAKGRAAGVWITLIMQKGTAENIPGGITSRDNIRIRIALKNENMSLLLDPELIEKHNIQADKLQGGQFVFMDTLKGEDSIIEGFVQQVDYELDPEKVTKELDTKEDKERTIKLKEYGKIAFKAANIEKEYIEELENNGNKTVIDNLQDFEEYKDRDFIQEAIDFYDKNEDGTLSNFELSENEEINFLKQLQKEILEERTDCKDLTIYTPSEEFIEKSKKILSTDLNGFIEKNEKENNKYLEVAREIVECEIIEDDFDIESNQQENHKFLDLAERILLEHKKENLKLLENL